MFRYLVAIFGRYLGFQLIYARGMFQLADLMSGNVDEFQLIYARGMFHPAAEPFAVFGLVSTHICAGNVFGSNRHPGLSHRCFNSYMRGECFIDGSKRKSRGSVVSTHICSGNVSDYIFRHLIDLNVSTHICAGNVSAFCAEETGTGQFQLIYARGMFQHLCIVLNDLFCSIYVKLNSLAKPASLYAC